MEKKFNDKNTKAQILEGYRELFQKYKELADNNLSAKDKVNKQSNISLIDNVEQGSISNLKLLADRIKEVYEDIDTTSKQYKELKEAIKIKEDELEELLGIDKEAFSLIALKEAQTKEQKEFEEEFSEYKIEQLNILNKEIDKYKQEIKDLIVDFARREEELKYNFTRQKKEQQDYIQDIKNQRDKEYENERSVLETVRIDLDQREKELEYKLEEIKAKHDKELAIATNSLKSKYENQIKLLEYEASSEKTQLDFKLQVLEDKISELTENNKYLSTKLDESYEKIQSLAKETVQGSQKDSMIKELSTLVKNNKKD